MYMYVNICIYMYMYMQSTYSSTLVHNLIYMYIHVCTMHRALYTDLHILVHVVRIPDAPLPKGVDCLDPAVPDCASKILDLLDFLHSDFGNNWHLSQQANLGGTRRAQSRAIGIGRLGIMMAWS